MIELINGDNLEKTRKKFKLLEEFFNLNTLNDAEAISVMTYAMVIFIGSGNMTKEESLELIETISKILRDQISSLDKYQL
jgi:L-asparaginase/Glu-tRNA(Gln) amidotransferase subunit D